jgi:hypothetical protein
MPSSSSTTKSELAMRASLWPVGAPASFIPREAGTSLCPG